MAGKKFHDKFADGVENGDDVGLDGIEIQLFRGSELVRLCMNSE